MSGSEPTLYEAHRTRARAAIARQKKAEAQEKRARQERDVEILAMLDTPGASLGSVATDVGLSKSMVAYIQRTAQTAITTAEQARAFLAAHPDE